MSKYPPAAAAVDSTAQAEPAGIVAIQVPDFVFGDSGDILMIETLDRYEQAFKNELMMREATSSNTFNATNG